MRREYQLDAKKTSLKWVGFMSQSPPPLDRGPAMSTNCDVLVIGAGPGGGSAALHSARLGLDVIIVEDHAEIGTPVHCGECLSSLAVENLKLDLPEQVIALRCKGIRVIFPDSGSRLLTEPGYVLEKHLFERWLVDQAVETGAELRLSHKVKSIQKQFNSENKFSNWKIDGKGEAFPIEAKVILDASGVHALCAKLLKMEDEIEVISGFQYEMHEVENDGYLDFYLWPKYSPHGYVWMIPKKEGRANIGLVTTDKKGAIRYLDSFIEDSYLKAHPKANPPWRTQSAKIKPFGGTIPISGPRQETYDDGLMLIGDAAGFTSPLFEGGSHLALKSGMFAAQVSAKAISEGDVSKAKLKIYQDIWEKEFPPYDKILKGKTALYELSEKELSFVGRCLPKEMSSMGILTKLVVGLKILFRKPLLYSRKVISVLLSFGYSRAKHHGW
ncbi:NAD(P)/FAD-dependent oxidoreductase [Deltaproteobacteria bacterium]|nr:NAD(P)/FAD-dependent oxidoreductase [Deltaproteobacteria bacterium]